MILFNKTKSLLLFLIVVLASSLQGLIAKSTDVEIIFKKVSHQNPWQVKEPLSQISSAIYIGDGTYFTISLANESPLMGEVLNEDRPNEKLQISKYDPSTGFVLLKKSFLDKNNYKNKSISFPKSSKICNFNNENYVQLSFSPVPIKAYKLDENHMRSEFLFQKKIFCGIMIGQYLIPSEYIQKFLNSKESSPIPHPGFEFESFINSSERSFYFPEERKGVIVKNVYPGIGPLHKLIPGDQIFEINSIPLSKVTFEELGNFAYNLILRKSGKLSSVGDIVHLRFIRNGQIKSLSYSLKAYSEKDFLVPSSHPVQTPPFLITGGLFFTELTGAYLKEYGENYRKKSEKKLLYLMDYYSGKQHPHRGKIIILSRLLPHPLTQSYHGMQDLILESINGKQIENMQDLKIFTQTSRDTFWVFQFSGNKQIIVKRNDIYKINSDITNSYRLKELDNLGY